MEVKLLDTKCALTKGYINDAGYDLRSKKNYCIRPGETIKIESGVCVQIPNGYSGDIRPRSSISSRGLLVHYGTVDTGYTGEINITVTNLNQNGCFNIDQYERVAQLVINRISDDHIIEYVGQLSNSERGNKGFGSTGRA